MVDSHQDLVPRIQHPFATNPTSLYSSSDAHQQDLAHHQRAYPRSTASGSHTQSLGPHSIQRSPSAASLSSARRLDSQQFGHIAHGSNITPRHRDPVPRRPSSRSLASASKPHAPSSTNTVPLDPDAIVQAAHPDHPDHQLWVERFGGTARRRAAPFIPPTSTSASTSASDPLGPGMYSGSSKRNSSHTYNSRSASARTGASSSLSSSSSSDEPFGPSGSPAPRPRRRAAASPNSDRKTRRQNGQKSTGSVPASSNVSRDSPSLAGSTTGKRRKRKDKGKVKAPSPPLPPPRVSSSVAPATASENPSTHHQSQTDRVHFPTGGTVPRPSVSLGEALEQVQGPREPAANLRTLDAQSATLPGASARGWHQAQNSSMHTNGASSSSRYPGSAHHTPKTLSGGSSSAHASTRGSSSYDTATQYLPRVSSDLSSPKRHAQFDEPFHPSSNTTAEEDDQRGAENAKADSSISQAPTASGPALQNTTRQRAGSLDLLRETLSFGTVKSAKHQNRGDKHNVDPQTAPSSLDNPPTRSSNTGLRIRASLDAIRPNFLTMSTKDNWSQDRPIPSQSLDVSKDADDSMDTTSEKPKRARVASFFSSLRNRSNQGRKADPRAVLPASVDSQSATRLAGRAFADRGSRSMDIPRRPVPNFEDSAAVPAVPAIPSSLTMPALSNAANPTLQAPQEPARARLSRVGEETEEGSDYADAQDGEEDSVNEFDGDDGAGQARKAAKSKAKLEQMLGEAFPHVPGGAIRSATPPPVADDVHDDKPGRSKTDALFEEKQRLPEPIYLSQQPRMAAIADQSNESGRTPGDPLANTYSTERSWNSLGHRYGIKPPSSMSSLRSHETSYTRSTSGATTIGGTTSTHGGDIFDADHDTSLDSKYRTGKFASFWNRSKKSKSRQSSMSSAVEGKQGSDLYRMDSTRTFEHAPSGIQESTADQDSRPTPTDVSRASAMAGLGIAPVLDTPAQSRGQLSPDHDANQRSVDSPSAPSTPNSARKGGAWRKRVSSISSLRSTRRGRQDWLENAPPTPSLPPSKSEPASGWANGSHAEEVQSPDEHWRRNLLAEAVNLSLRVSTEPDPKQAKRNTLWPDSIEVGDQVAFEQNAKTKRSPFLDVVAASRKSFSRDRARPTKAELDELREPGLPTIHKSLSPALLSELRESHPGHGRSDSMAYSVDSAVDSIEPRGNIEDTDAQGKSRGASSDQIATPPHSAVTRPLHIVKPNTMSSHSRSTSQQSDHSGGSGSARFRVPRVPVPGATEAVNGKDVNGDRGHDGRGGEERLQVLELQSGNHLDVSSSQSSVASPTSPASPVSPGKQSGSFAGKRATLGKHATPPCLQLSPPKEEMLRSPSDESGHTGQGTPRSAQWGRLGTSPGPSLSSRQGVRASPRSTGGFLASPSSGFSPSGAGRTSFSTDRDRAPVASPYVNHAGSSAGSRAGNLRGAFRKFTASAVSPKVRGFGFSNKGISSDQQPNEEDMPFWDDSLAAAQAATQMLQAHTDMLMPSPSMTPLTATHSRPETASLTGSTTSGGQAGSSGRFGPFHNGGDSGSGSGMEDREVMSNAFASANKSSTSLGGGGGLPGGPMSASGSFPRSATSMTFRDHTRSTTAPATSGVSAGVRSASSSSSLQGTGTTGPPSAAASSSSFPSDLQALDAMLRAQKTNEEAMLKSISARTRTASQPQTSSPLPMS